MLAISEPQVPRLNVARVAHPLATCAIYSFASVSWVLARHLYLPHDGYPTGAAWRFAEALRENPQPASFLAAFLGPQRRAEPIQCPAQTVDAEYCYWVQLVPGADPQLQVHCWSRLPSSSAWHPRCGPMALATFIRRFLPDGLPV